MPNASDSHRDMIDFLLRDHRDVEKLLSRLETGAGTPQHRRDLADAVAGELIRHAVVEEEYVCPMARGALPDGDRIADHEIADHVEIERTLKDWEGIPADDPRFDVLCRKVISEIRHHIRDEESNLFPRLRAACGREELVDLGRKMEIAKLVPPNRPYPAIPDRPRLARLLASGAGFVGRVRDTLSHRGGTPRHSRKDTGRRTVDASDGVAKT